MDIDQDINVQTGTAIGSRASYEH